MNLLPYKNVSDFKDLNIYFLDPELMEIPEEFNPAVLMFHVKKVEVKAESDYTIKTPFRETIHYRCSTESSRKSRLNQRTTDPNAVTNYECLMALGREETIVVYSLE